MSAVILSPISISVATDALPIYIAGAFTDTAAAAVVVPIIT
jgi:hypothetical protein